MKLPDDFVESYVLLPALLLVVGLSAERHNGWMKGARGISRRIPDWRT